MKTGCLNNNFFQNCTEYCFISLLFIPFLITASVYGNGIELKFKESAFVNDTVIVFGDIASVESENPGITEKIKQIVAGVSAPAGFSRFVSAEDVVVYRLKPLFKNTQINISGSRRVSVYTDCVKKSISDYKEEIIYYIKSNLSWPKKCFSITLLNSQEYWKVLNAPFKVNVKGLSNSYAKGNTQVELIAQQGNRTFRIAVRCKIDVTVPVIVASRQIKRGELIGMQDCEFRKMNITRFGPTPLSSIENLKNMQVLRTIEPGTIIHDRLLKKKPVIEKGDRVTILSEFASVRVSVSAVARESGNIGEKIWVQNENSNKLMHVTVLGKRRVAISKGGNST